jgi:hypothetical protein
VMSQHAAASNQHSTGPTGYTDAERTTFCHMTELASSLICCCSATWSCRRSTSKDSGTKTARCSVGSETRVYVLDGTRNGVESREARDYTLPKRSVNCCLLATTLILWWSPTSERANHCDARMPWKTILVTNKQEAVSMHLLHTGPGGMCCCRLQSTSPHPNSMHHLDLCKLRSACTDKYLKHGTAGRSQPCKPTDGCT